MTPFVVGRDPWNREAMRRDAFTHGLWQFRAGTGNFAWAGHRHGALGHLRARVRRSRSGVCSAAAAASRGDVLLLPRRAGTREPRGPGRRRARAAGFEVFYLKVGLDDAEDLARSRPRGRRSAPAPRLRLDANGSWSLPQARSQPPGASRSTTSTSSNSRFAIIRSGSSPSVAQPHGHDASARTKVSGRKPTRTRASVRDRPTSSASRRTGSVRSGASTGSPGSRSTKGSRSASTRTASSASRPRRCTTSS